MDRDVVLHVAAMPFPSPQGTQAAVRAMLEALAAAGQATDLATYARGRGDVEGAPYVVHRVLDFPRDRSLRSGPSARKLVLDASLALHVAQLVRRLRPRLVVAHHAEAMLAALAARVRPLVYVAHTALGPELPAYLGRWRALAPAAHRAGSALDTALVRAADVACAIAPALAEDLSALGRRTVHALPLPWPPSRAVPAAVSLPDRAAARRALGIDGDERVLLYAGNLDVYQGVATLLDAATLVASRAPRIRLLVATESDASELRRDARARGLALTAAPLAVEDDRVRAHAAADVALVPRALPGGVPVKLLDALARGVPVVASRRATGGLALGDAALVVSDDDAEALAVGVRTLLAAPSAGASLADAGRAYLAREHAPAAFVAAFAHATRRLGALRS